MSVIKLECVEQSLHFTNVPAIYSGDVNYDTLEVEFDSSWNNYTKTAIFYRSKDEVFYQVVNNGSCKIPKEVLKDAGYFYIGIFGAYDDSVVTTEIKKYKVSEGAITEDLETPDPNPDIWEQILADYGSLRTDLLTLESQFSSEYATIKRNLQADYNTTKSNLEADYNAVKADIYPKLDAKASKTWTQLCTLVNDEDPEPTRWEWGDFNELLIILSYSGVQNNDSKVIPFNQFIYATEMYRGDYKACTLKYVPGDPDEAISDHIDITWSLFDSNWTVKIFGR